MLLFSSRQKKTFLRKPERCTKRSISPRLFEGRVALRPTGKSAYDSREFISTVLRLAVTVARSPTMRSLRISMQRISLGSCPIENFALLRSSFARIL